MEMRDMGAVLWRQRVIVLLVLLVTGAAVYLGVQAAPKTYTATAELQTSATDVAGAQDGQDSLRATLGELASSRSVVQAVQHDLPVERSYDDLRTSIHGQFVQGTQLVQVTADDSDPQVAAQIANAATQALSEQDPSNGQFSYTVSNPARAPLTYSSPNLLLALALGIVLALVLAACAALLRDRRTYRIRDAQAVEEALGAPLLAHIPALRDPTLQAMYAGTPAADIFRRLRISLEAAAAEDPASLVVVTGAASGDVNAWIAANLAISLANVGRRTLLVDARMGGGTGRPTGLEPETPGLYEVLRGSPLSAGVSRGPVDNLWVLPSGKWGAEPADELLETSFLSTFDKARDDFDVVVVIAHPLPTSDDAVIMSAAGAAIMVVTEGTVRPAELERLSRRVTTSGTRLLGGVLVGKKADGGQ